MLKVPKVRNENWERAKPAFKPLLEEALQIRADIRKKKDTADNDKVYFGGFGSKLEEALGMTRKSTEYYASKEELWASMENTPGGWLDRANTTLGEYGLQCFLDRIPRDGDAIYFAIVDPQSPEELPAMRSSRLLLRTLLSGPPNREAAASQNARAPRRDGENERGSRKAARWGRAQEVG